MRCLKEGGSARGMLRWTLTRYTTSNTPVTGLKSEDVKPALAMEPVANLCNDYEAIQSAVLEGKPAPPASRYGASVQALCRQLAHKTAPEKKSAAPWLNSLLRRKAVSR